MVGVVVTTAACPAAGAVLSMPDVVAFVVGVPLGAALFVPRLPAVMLAALVDR
jgi:hypothetical protein